MRKFIILLILPIIGFSQCENPILDEVLQNTEVNQYFQLALSLNVAELQFLNDCDVDVSYTMFVPGNDVPNESAGLLLELGGELMDYISYYIHMGFIMVYDLEYVLSGSTIQMMDGNEVSVNSFDPNSFGYAATINQAEMINGDICACNGVIHIINDLIWAPGVISLNENNNKMGLCVNYKESSLKVSKINNPGLLEIKDINGKVIFTQTTQNNITINTSSYNSGLYIIEFKSPQQNLRELIFIN